MIDRAFLFSALAFSGAAYFALDASAPNSLVLEMTTGSSSTGQVFWSRDDQDFTEAESAAISVRPGRSRYQVVLPSRFTRLRIDPGGLPGAITIHRIAIVTLAIPIMTWDGGGQFSGWVPTHDLSNIELVKDGLSMMAVSNDPFLVNRRLGWLAGRRVGVLALMAMVCGVACAFLHALLSRAARTVETVDSGIRLRRPRVVTVVIASLLALGVGGYFVQLSRRRSPPSDKSLTAIMLVDRRGRSLSERPGVVKVELSPFSLYRNAPNQKTEHFSTNESGYRGRTLVGDPRPKVVILGGSAAFGLGLDSDTDALDVQLETMNPGYRFVNAGVIGSSSGQELAEMMHYADSLVPRLYIAMDGWNDFFEAHAQGESFSNLGYNQAIFEQLEGQLRSCTGPVALEGWRHLLPVPRIEEDRKKALVVEGYLANLARMSSFARSRGAAFLVLFQPEMSGDPKLSREYREMLDAAASFCEKHAIAHFDLQNLPQFTQNPSAVFLEGVHLNAKGIRLVAEVAEVSVKRLLPVQ